MWFDIQDKKFYLYFFNIFLAISIIPNIDHSLICVTLYMIHSYCQYSHLIADKTVSALRFCYFKYSWKPVGNVESHPMSTELKFEF